MINKKDNTVEKIIVRYEDGTEKEINKGVVICDSVNKELYHTLTMEFANISGPEFTDITLGILQMAGKMGMFNGSDEE